MAPLITEVQVKQRGLVVAVTLHGEDEPVLLPSDTAALHHLREGVQLPPEQWRAVRSEGRRLLATRKALDILARRSRTESELAKALGGAFEDDEVAHAVERMRALGYLDDATIAKHYVSSPRSATRGRTLLKHELSRRGVPGAIAASAVEEHDERPAALEAARKRVRALRRVQEPQRSRRLYDFLRRRGFADGVAREAIARVASEGAAEATDEPNGASE